MPRVVLDENVSLQAGACLQIFGYEVIAVAKLPERGMHDEAVFGLASEDRSLLITRDAHFTNPLRFPPDKTGGILYLTAGNLQGREEASLIEDFMRAHRPEEFSGRLVFLSRGSVRIR